MNNTTGGAVSGGASGAQAGMAFGPWGAAAGGVIGAGAGALGGRAADQAEARRRRLEAIVRQAQAQDDARALAESQGLESNLRGLNAQRYGQHTALAQGLGGQEWLAAGQAASDAQGGDLSRALGMVNMAPVGNRGLVGAGPEWGQNVAATHSPMLDARRRLILAQRGQQGMQTFDENALNQNQAGGIDLNRQAEEGQQGNALLRAFRARQMADVQRRYADTGATNGENNAQLFSRLVGAGLQTAGGMKNMQNQDQASAQNTAARRLIPTQTQWDQTTTRAPFGPVRR